MAPTGIEPVIDDHWDVVVYY